MAESHKKNLSWHTDIEIARELRYPKKVIRLLEDEPNPERRQRILYDARKGVYGER